MSYQKLICTACGDEVKEGEPIVLKGLRLLRNSGGKYFLKELTA